MCSSMIEKPAAETVGEELRSWLGARIGGR
jgi:hypothetical protein